MEADYIIIYKNGRRSPICDFHAEEYGVFRTAPFFNAKIEPVQPLSRIMDKHGYSTVHGPIQACHSCLKKLEG